VPDARIILQDGYRIKYFNALFIMPETRRNMLYAGPTEVAGDYTIKNTTQLPLFSLSKSYPATKANSNNTRSAIVNYSPDIKN
jgi:hypothetical protein